MTNSAKRQSVPFVLLGWAGLSLLLLLLAWRTIHQTGLDYDEAVYGHLARDFLLDRTCAQHMPGSVVVDLAGRPFPVFVQGYLGAVKCWLLIPGFAVLGSSITVMRLTMLAVGLMGILFLMLWTRRALGGPAAVLTGFLVGLDPAFFFPTVCEWGAFVPSFFCRCAGWYFLLVWWRERRAIWMGLAGATFGVGFFNKIDFVVVLLALAAAALVTRPVQLGRSVRTEWRSWVLGASAFGVAGSLMIVNLVQWFRAVLEVQSGTRAGELTTKFNVARAMLDGSYFYRLMEAGGVFPRMFETAAPVWSPFGVVLGIAVIALIIFLLRDDERTASRHWPRFLLTGCGVAAVGVWWLPDAVRIHHALLVYPFPQLIIAAAAIRVRQVRSGSLRVQRTIRLLVGLALAAVLCGHLAAILRTQQFITTTGGRGQWSLALQDFATGIGAREGVMLVSLDWGFHEQLSFLTDVPQRFEPVWNMQAGKPVSLLPDPRCYYLIHPPEFSVFPFGEECLQAAQQADPSLAVESFTNREGRVVFRVFRFTAP